MTLTGIYQDKKSHWYAIWAVETTKGREFRHERIYGQYLSKEEVEFEVALRGSKLGPAPDRPRAYEARSDGSVIELRS